MLAKHRFIWIMAVLALILMLAVGCGKKTSQPEEAVEEETTEQVDEPASDEEEAAVEETAADEEETAVEEEAAAEEVTLTIWSWRVEDEDAYNEIFDVYEAAHPGVTVEFVPFVATDYNNILATGLTGEGGPDIAQLRAYGGVQPLIEAGQLLPLDGEIESLSNFPDAILKGATGQADGRIYGVPFGVQAFTAYYNKTIFDELGLTEPETWDEFIAVLDALQAADYIPISAPAKDTWMLPLIHDAVAAPRYGGPEFEAAVLAGETDFTNPDYVASIGVVQDLQQYMPEDIVGISYADSKTLFLTEQAGIFLGGSFEVGFWREEGPDMDLGIFRVPAPPDSLTGPLVPGWMDGSYGVNALSDSPDAAKELVNWMGTPEFGQMFTEQIKQLSAIPGMTPTDPLLAEFAELFAESPTSYLHLVNFRYGDPYGSTLLADGIQAMFLGDSDPETIANDIQTGVSQWFNPNGEASVEPAEAEPVTLTVWSWRTEDEDAYNEIFDVYEEANPNVTVEFVPFIATDYNNILATGLTGEGGPDVAQLRAYGGIQPLIEAGQLLPLDGEIATLGNFPDAILKGASGQADGRVYGVPFGVQTFTAFYNKAIFEELGLTEPQTWDEFIAALDALQAGGYIPLAVPAKDTWMLPLIHDAVAAPRYGGPEFEAEVLSGATDFNDPDYVASIAVIQDLQQYMPADVVGVSYNDAKTLFLTEMAGIFLGGSFEVGFWRNEGPELDLGVFRVPAPPDSLVGPVVPGWMDGSYGVNALSDSPDAAKDLVEWMGTPEFAQLFTVKIKQLSAMPGAQPEDPLLAEFAELFAESPASYLHLVNFRYGDPSGSTLLADGIQAMFLGEATPEQIAADIQEGISQWFTPSE